MKMRIGKKALRTVLMLLLLVLIAVPQFAFDAHAEENSVMEVTVDNNTTSYADFGEGWIYAVKESRNNPTTVKLLSDWIAPDGKFEYKDGGDEYGTDNGRLHLATSSINLTIDLNGHTISRNLSSAVSHGQVFRIENGNLTITDTAGGGKITGGNNSGDGGAVYMTSGNFYLKGGTITGNTANKGGGIYMDNGTLYVEGGSISGNEASEGGGVHWSSDDKFVMTGGTITGNKASEHGGGVYFSQDGPMYVGGTAVITGNKVGDKAENLYVKESAYLHQTVGQDNVPNKPFETGAMIGITAEEVRFETVFGRSSDLFDANSAQYFTSDDPTCDVYSGVDGNGYKLWMGIAYEGCMWVTPDDGETVEFTDFGKGWVYATSQSDQSHHVTVKLGGDWVARNGNFYYKNESGEESGTSDGRLHMFGDNITIDLNGYTIDRNLDSPTQSGGTFYNFNGSLTITDSKGGGKITGGKSTSGGVFAAYHCDLTIKGGTITGNEASTGSVLYGQDVTFIMEGGTITGNRASNDGTIYAFSGDYFIRGGKIINNTAGASGGGIFMHGGDLFVTGGEISGNTAANNGGGICISSPSTVNSYTVVLTGGTITGNTASGHGGGVSIGDYGSVYVGGKLVIANNTDANRNTNNLCFTHGNAHLKYAAGQSTNVPNEPFEANAYIGMSIKEGTNRQISCDDSYFASDSITHFAADSADFVVRSVPNTSDNDHPYKLYLTKKENVPASKTVSFASGNKNAQGSMAAVTDLQDTIYTLPVCGFTAPENTHFHCWSIAGTNYAPGDMIVLNNDITVTAVWKYNTPEVSFAASGADSGTLSNVLLGMKYSLDGGSNWVECKQNPETVSGLTGGSTIQVIHAAYGDTLASDTQTINISRAAAPTGVTAIAATCSQANGKLVGLATDMEFSTDGSLWTAVTKSEITDLAAGTYYVRTKFSGASLASEAVALEVTTNHTIAENPQEEYLVSAATCTNPAVYKKSCTVCSTADKTETFEYGTPIEHSKIYTIVDGKLYYSCENCAHEGEAITVEHSGKTVTVKAAAEAELQDTQIYCAVYDSHNRMIAVRVVEWDNDEMPFSFDDMTGAVTIKLFFLSGNTAPWLNAVAADIV